MNRHDVLFVLVLYRCNLSSSKTFQTLIKEEKLALFIYDNSPTPSDDWVKYQGMTQYVSDPSNSGLSAAYNKAANYAKLHGFKWIMLLDQDTSFTPDALDVYEKAVNEHTDIEMFVPKHILTNGKYISPTKYLFKTSYPQKKVKEGRLTFKEACPINSGILVSTKSFFEAGGYDDDVVLDFSDIRFIEKYRKHHKLFCCINVVCIQDFSINEGNPQKLMGRFNLFLKSAKACKRENLGDSMAYMFVTLKRALRLTFQTQDLSFITSYFRDYVFRIK